jgi:hypothetical protein
VGLANKVQASTEPFVAKRYINRKFVKTRVAVEPFSKIRKQFVAS